jgi:hypothetical protein
MEEFCNRFMSLSCRDHSLTEHQQVQLFTIGLGKPLRTDVALQRPKTLDEEIMLARAYEQRTLLPAAPAASASNSTSRSATKSWPTASSAPTASTPSSRPTLIKKFSTTEIADRRVKGLCFKCDEKFVSGHRESCKPLFCIDVLNDDEDDDDPTILIHALTRIQPRTSTTMQVLAHVGGATLHILLDSGSMHNFIDTAAAERAGVQLQCSTELRVAVANGDRLSSFGRCTNLAITIADEEFHITSYGLSLGSFDMVLGVQWLESLGAVLWNFQRRTLAFVRNGRRILWSASPNTSQHAALAAASHDDMEDLLLHFCTLFAMPTGLLPERPWSHRIHLLQGTGAVAVRSYRYAHAQKKELQRQCNDMLPQGVIRPSASVFSTPILLIKKQDKTWRFYVDYRAVNECTIKDKFPIPVVEDLLDELCGTAFFTKLDLRSGYHQVRMHSYDVEMTVFCTH